MSQGKDKKHGDAVRLEVRPNQEVSPPKPDLVKVKCAENVVGSSRFDSSDPLAESECVEYTDYVPDPTDEGIVYDVSVHPSNGTHPTLSLSRSFTSDCIAHNGRRTGSGRSKHKGQPERDMAAANGVSDRALATTLSACTVRFQATASLEIDHTDLPRRAKR
jgi:hypothetical protein